MNDELVERLLAELVETRHTFASTTRAFVDATNSFNDATKHIKWNRRNTIIQYILIVAVLLMGALGVRYYFDDKKASCERGNELRVSIVDSFDTNARAIGFALAVVSDAPDAMLQEYVDVYNQQAKPEALELREC